MTADLKRCLIIDDDESFRQLVSRYVSLMFPDVIIEEYDPASSGPPPVDCDWSGCDLVILDYWLNSELTGLDLLNAWRKQEDVPPVIMMTAAGSEDVAVKAMKTGVQDYLRKQNLTREKLEQAIRDAVSHHNDERERQQSVTHNSQSLNKALFYQKLEKSPDDDSQVFFLVELDRFAELSEMHGMIIPDNLVRHIAGICHASFSEPAYQASITRMSDAAVGLLFTPRPEQPLEAECARLQEAFRAQPFAINDENIDYTVSIGGVHLSGQSGAREIIDNARSACRSVQQQGGNGYQLHPLQQDEAGQVRESAPSAAVTQRKSTAAVSEPVRTADTETGTLSEQDLMEMTLELSAEKLQPENHEDTPAFDIKQAFADNRALQYYQPIMPLSERANQLKSEYYSIRIRMVDMNGSIVEADDIMSSLRNERNQKLLDRWMMRQTIGRIISLSENNRQSPTFIIRLSDESFADANLFNWLQNKLMKSLSAREPGKSLFIEVSATTYLAKQRQVEALFKFLRQSYGFRFALSSFSDIDQLNSCLEKSRFDIYKISQPLLAELQARQADATAMPPVVSMIRQRKAMLVATLIENADMLTQAINCGADFAMGYFIGSPIDNIGEMSQIESFELT